MKQELSMNTSIKPLAALSKSHFRLTSLHQPGLSTQAGRAWLAKSKEVDHTSMYCIFIITCVRRSLRGGIETEEVLAWGPGDSTQFPQPQTYWYETFFG